MPKRPSKYTCVFKVELFGHYPVMALDERDARITFHTLHQEKVLVGVQEGRTTLLGVYPASEASKSAGSVNGRKNKVTQ